jgi:hypothetical protein
MAQTLGGTAGMQKIAYANQMMIEDHLNKCLAKTSNKPFKVSNNKLLPKSQHSPFGDFPKEYMPSKGHPVTDMENTIKHEQSIAAQGVCKLKLLMYNKYFDSNFEKRRRIRWKSH